MTQAQKIQEVKKFIVQYAFQYGWNRASIKSFADEAETVISIVAMREEAGFAAEIAQTVEKYKRVSEKQAYWIAKAAVELDITTRIDYLWENEEVEEWEDDAVCA